tara:strand:+ start:938 stop:1237 length:300 start_codon:yes stop_codon:yes gene_type:complete
MSESQVEVTEDLVERYISLTKAARIKATPLQSADSEDGIRLSAMLEMADSYASDAKWFVEQGDLVRAFGAINYAHAWIDCAVKIGLMDGHGDDEMFTLP